jgi:farnesyl diphosphate synthase
MQNKLIKIAKDNELFLKNFIEAQKKTDLIAPMNYGLFSGGK